MIIVSAVIGFLIAILLDAGAQQGMLTPDKRWYRVAWPASAILKQQRGVPRHAAALLLNAALYGLLGYGLERLLHFYHYIYMRGGLQT
jgi:hypothetical protein